MHKKISFLLYVLLMASLSPMQHQCSDEDVIMMQEALSVLDHAFKSSKLTHVMKYKNNKQVWQLLGADRINGYFKKAALRRDKNLVIFFLESQGALFINSNFLHELLADEAVDGDVKKFIDAFLNQNFLNRNNQNLPETNNYQESCKEFFVTKNLF